MAAAVVVGGGDRVALMVAVSVEAIVAAVGMVAAAEAVI